MNIKRLLNNKIVKNASWLMAEKICQSIINLLISILTTRFLGPSNFGLISYATAYTAFFTSLCNLGINSILIKSFTDKEYDEGTILGTTIALRGASSLCSIIVINSMVALIDANEPITKTVVLLSSIGLFFHIFEVFNYWFQSRLQSKITAIASLIAYLITATYRVILLMFKSEVQYFAFATSVDYVCVAIILYYCYRKYSGERLKFSWHCGKYLLGNSYHFILSGMMVAIYGYVDKFMLKHMINQVETGYYSSAVSIATMWCFVLSAIIRSVYPSIVESHKNNDKEKYEKRNKELYAIIFYLSLVVSIFFVFFGKYVVYVVYGKAYSGAVMPLKIVTWYVAFSYLGVARDAWIVCENKQKYLKYIYITASVLNVVLNGLLIPEYQATGAAIATVITQSVTILVTAFIKELRPNFKLISEGIMLKGIIQ